MTTSQEVRGITSHRSDGGLGEITNVLTHWERHGLAIYNHCLWTMIRSWTQKHDRFSDMEKQGKPMWKITSIFRKHYLKCDFHQVSSWQRDLFSLYKSVAFFITVFLYLTVKTPWIFVCYKLGNTLAFTTIWFCSTPALLHYFKRLNFHSFSY